jgi:tetratricopeptide (TPR) repeat protein
VDVGARVEPSTPQEDSMSDADRRDRRRRGAEQQRRRAEAEEQRRAARRAAVELSQRTAQARAAARGAGRPATRKERRAAKRARIAAMPLHRRRRRRLLLWSWLPALLLLAFALNLSRMAPGYAAAREIYDHGDEWRAIDAFEQVKDRTIVERWRAAFNAGTAAYRAGRYTRAVQHLDEALAGVPEKHRCDVQTNRALALQAAEASAAERAQEQLAYAEALGTALAAQAAGEPFDPEDLEPRYGDEPPVLADELSYASFLIRIAADNAALAAEALGDPACTPPPSQGGGGEDDQEDQGGGGGGQDEQGGGADEQDGGEDDASSSPQAAAEQRMQDLLDLATGVEQLARAAEDGTIDDVPAPGSGPGDQGAPDPAQAEAERQQQLAERNGQAGGGGGDGAEGEGESGSGGRGGGDQPGTGGGGRGGRNW